MNKETTMEEWVADYEYMFNYGYSHSPYAKATHKIDDLIKFCTKCEMTWERFYNPKGKDWEKYDKNVIPIINKERKLCPPCKSKEKQNDTRK